MNRSPRRTERGECLVGTPPLAVEKEACQLIEIDKPLFREELHEVFTSIPCEIVGKNFARGVISEAHVPGNDEILFYSVICG